MFRGSIVDCGITSTPSALSMKIIGMLILALIDGGREKWFYWSVKVTGCMVKLKFTADNISQVLIVLLEYIVNKYNHK